MKQISKTVELNKYTSKLMDFYFPNSKFAVFDIETTGLSPKHSQLLLSGFLTCNGGNFKSVQFLAESNMEEAHVIEETVSLLNSMDYIITYNGRNFDIPFINKRATHLGIAVNSLPYNLDLYQVVSTSSTLKSVLPNLRQKTMENYMNISSNRIDEISGGECILLFRRYLMSGDEKSAHLILQHNLDDIIQLYRLLPIIKSCNFHQAMSMLGFCCGNFSVEDISISAESLTATGYQTGDPIDYIAFPSVDNPMYLQLERRNRKFTVSVPCQKAQGACYCDVLSVLGEKANNLEKYPGFHEGYLIVSQQEQINYMSINFFLIEALNDLTYKLF